MPDQAASNRLDRRAFLHNAAMLSASAGLAAGLAAALPGQAAAAETDVHGADLKTNSGKPLRGLYPIMETPFTADDKLNTDALAAQVAFLNRGRVAGMVWPVFASSWSSLSDAERITGVETILAANKQAAAKGGRSSVAIAVQNTAWDIPTSVRYAQHAAAHGADAIALMPKNNGWNIPDDDMLAYYKTIAAATDLPLIVQTRGTVSVDLMLRMFKEIPTMKATKDEVGNPLDRVAPLMAGSNGKLAIWAAGGGTGNLLLQELPLGIVGLCPTPQYAEFLQQAMELYWAGKKSAAFDMWARVQGFAALPGASEYMMVARGVFPEGTKSRPQPMEPEARGGGAAGGGGGAAAGGGGGTAGGGGGGRRGAAAPLTDKDKQFIRDAIDTYLKPFMRG